VGAGKGLVAFINRWNNLDAHPPRHPPTDTRSSTDRDLHSHRCAVYGLALSSSIRSNPIDIPATNADNSHIFYLGKPVSSHVQRPMYTQTVCVLFPQTFTRTSTPPPLPNETLAGQSRIPNGCLCLARTHTRPSIRSLPTR